jgi:hypothetical protein
MSTSALAQSQPGQADQKQAFRPPFELKLHIDKKPDYEQHFDRTPYVAGNEVFVFPGERFGIYVTVKDNQIASIAYEPEGAKSDIEFHLSQEKITDTMTIMMLVTRNGLKRTLVFDARMSIPKEKDPFKTDITPIEPGLSSYESWPNPIIELVLSNFRFTDAAAAQR